IKLGTGVVSASYHNPLWVAERAVQLDHMTRGRFMLGLGPGALPSDAEMIGLDMPQTRELLEDAVDVIVRLMRSDDPVSFENGRWSLRDARLHLRPYTHPHPEIAITPVASPGGTRPSVGGRATRRGLRRARAALGRDGGAGCPLRRLRGPGRLAARGAD